VLESLVRGIADDAATALAIDHIERLPTLKLYPLIDDVAAEAIPDPEWGIDGLYSHGGFVLVFGPRGTGKMFLTLGWSPGSALRVQRGTACLGRHDDRGSNGSLTWRWPCA
jgi:hypothetical protein